MSSGRDKVLSCDSLDEFSGFSAEEEVLPSKEKTVKSVVVKPSTCKKADTKSGKKPKKTQKGTVAKSRGDKNSNSASNTLFDLNKLSNDDISRLRDILGVQPVLPVESEPLLPLESLPNLRVEVDSGDVSDSRYDMGHAQECFDINNDMSKALFADGEDTDEGDMWLLPKLKVPQKGKAISQGLADMINMACSSSCDIDGVLHNYCVPENCDRACPPVVNTEVWRIMDRRSQIVDKGIVEIQNLVSAGITPIIKLAEVMKKQIADNTEAKQLMSDALILFGQVQFMLSLRRRYLIRPALKKKYHGLCNINMPITTKLFGDDVSKDIKACDSTSTLGTFYPYSNRAHRGRGSSRFSRRPYGNRYTPYGARGQSRPYGQNRFGGYRIPKKGPSATVTAPPNE